MFTAVHTQTILVDVAICQLHDKGKITFMRNNSYRLPDKTILVINEINKVTKWIQQTNNLDFYENRERDKMVTL